jgi:hypothetical protein
MANTRSITQLVAGPGYYSGWNFTSAGLTGGSQSPTPNENLPKPNTQANVNKANSSLGNRHLQANYNEGFWFNPYGGGSQVQRYQDTNNQISSVLGECRYSDFNAGISRRNNSINIWGWPNLAWLGIYTMQNSTTHPMSMGWTEADVTI